MHGPKNKKALILLVYIT